MNYATIKKCDIANGEGVRVSLFVSGCTHHCKNCFNEVAWDFQYGNEFNEGAKAEIFAELDLEYISGLSVLGGEPMDVENQEGVCLFLRDVKKCYPEKSIWLYTGYDYDEHTGELKQTAKNTIYTKEIFSYCDVVVDGAYIDELRDISLVFRGSANQRIIDMRKTVKMGKIVLYID